MRRNSRSATSFLRLVEVALDRRQRVLVILVARQFEQVAGVAQARTDAGQGADHGFE
jgi:hypothetical protein